MTRRTAGVNNVTISMPHGGSVPIVSQTAIEPMKMSFSLRCACHDDGARGALARAEAAGPERELPARVNCKPRRRLARRRRSPSRRHMPVGACSRAATIACAAADDRLELLASLRALRAAGLMIAHGFTVEQMVEMCAPGSCDGDRHAMGAGWSALRHQASSSPRGPCRRHNSGGTESHESLLGQRHRDDAIGAGRGTISIVMPREGSITCAMCAPTHGHEVTRAKRRWRRSGRPGGGGKRRGSLAGGSIQNDSGLPQGPAGASGTSYACGKLAQRVPGRSPCSIQDDANSSRCSAAWRHGRSRRTRSRRRFR